MRYLITVFTLLLLSSTLFGDFVNGTVTCAASGNKQMSTTSYSLYQLTVTAAPTNTGNVAIGGVSVTTSNAPLLAAGYSANWTKPNAAINPASLYIACTVSSDTIQWVGSR
jgi:hypothetical protein